MAGYVELTLREEAYLHDDSGDILLSQEQQDRIISICLPSVAETFAKDPVSKRQIAARYCRYIQNRLSTGQYLPHKRPKVNNKGSEPTSSRQDLVGNTSFPSPTPVDSNCEGQSSAAPDPTQQLSTRVAPPIPPRPTSHSIPDPRLENNNTSSTYASSISPSSSTPSSVSPVPDNSSQKSSPGSANQKDSQNNRNSSQQATNSNGPVQISSSAKSEKLYPFEEKLEDFLTIVEFFGNRARSFSDKTVAEYCNQHPEFNPEQVVLFLGTWLFSDLHFSRLTCDEPKEYQHLAIPYLVDKCRIFPAIQQTGEETDQHVLNKTVFNGERLVNLAGIQLVSTAYIGNHLHFDKRTKTLFLFMVPGVTWNNNQYRNTTPFLPFPLGLTDEIARTFAFLFNSNSASRRIFNKFQASQKDLKPITPSLRMRRRMIGEIWTAEDPLMNPNMADWGNIPETNTTRMLNVIQGMRGRVRGIYKLSHFPYFGQRLLVLERYLNEMKPTSWRELLKDSRDQLQYYTFMIAVVVFVMTVLGLILSVLQTIASYLQLNSSS
ncbi:hypothetical protein BDZ91DRAFT_852620 [Kalaharituber pfeilii]|nr:hypothetical protein BDZ91DRAFT_852620 [Kalaharituber pfeilii]